MRILNVLKITIGIMLLSGNAASAQDGDPAETEVWAPEPAVVTPGDNGGPPSDAIVLFDGGSLEAWEHPDGSDVTWTVENGAMTVKANPEWGAGDIRTRQGFGDVQLHVEWMASPDDKDDSQGRSNSGVFLMGLYEVQVLDSYDNRTYSNGQAASIYKQHIPLVNAMRPPGQWQVYDIVFRAPTFGDDGELASAATVTVFHNGVLVQDHVEIQGPTVYIGEPSYRAHADRLPIVLQDHGDRVSYRNIWVRELD